MKIVVATHGNLAYGFKDALEMMCNDLEDICFLSLNNQGIKIFEDELKAVIDINQPQVILTDIACGSPHLTCLKLKQKLNLEAEVISGVNFPMLLDCYLSKSQYNLVGLSDKIINSAIEGISIGNLQHNINEGDE